MRRFLPGNSGNSLMQHIEHIACNGTPLAYIIRAEIDPRETTFVTPGDFKQQVGFIVYPAGAEIPRHVHRPVERRLNGTSEVLIVRRGHCEVDIYNNARDLVAVRKLSAGDILILVAGGHGFRMLEDTVLLEVKQGPYTGLEEKNCF
jgi:quercetin dioxygenase-like cupin family protein